MVKEYYFRVFKRAWSRLISRYGWNWNTAISSIFLFIVGSSVYLFFLGMENLKEKWIEAIAFSITPILLLFIITMLWDLIVVPAKMYKEQEEQIAALYKIADRETTVNHLIELRKSGVEKRNRGERFIHESQVEPWWKEHLEWREETVKTISLLDRNLADKWKVLGTYSPKRPFPTALSQIHRKYLQMYDAWLERLDEVIEKLNHRRN